MKKIILAISILISIQAIALQQEPTKKKTETLAKNGTDPVCKMPVKKGTKLVSTHKEKQYGFCNKMCKDQFDKQPEKFIK
ncbi:YHS domain-containing protein [Lacihabitans sp. LS3-19]|uniref:YHS domain-containing protein n=1 Tax=Lacihabitans sp. LS3-19 TaxID=2487335 RepID=UPI0020CEBEFA|nr:YHS domain-containing protein [Lacihabitans sp. LS3-19]